jgi:GNAT superfamily N-acetyltransferase
MVEIRPCASRADDERSLEIYNAVWPANAVDMDFVDAYKAGATVWVDLLASINGAPIGSGFASVHEDRPTIGFFLNTVLPEHRRRGAGTALYRAVSEWAREHQLEAFDAVCPADDPEAIGFAKRRGYTVVERNGLLVLELGEIAAPAIDAPAGVEIATLSERPDTAEGIYAVAAQAEADVPGRGREAIEPFAHWVEHDLHGPGTRVETTFIALAGDDVVGYAQLSFTTAQPGVAFHRMTGVRRDWRSRGVAGALKRAQVRWAKEAGLRRMQTENELSNEPIRRLNMRLGYVEAPGEVVMRGPLAA